MRDKVVLKEKNKKEETEPKTILKVINYNV